ncbi:MAG: hypothetical protein RLZZ127_598 [Planctomycetota bacterium]|jgi:hypothetical protein
MEPPLLIIRNHVDVDRVGTEPGSAGAFVCTRRRSSAMAPTLPGKTVRQPVSES